MKSKDCKNKLLALFVLILALNFFMAPAFAADEDLNSNTQNQGPDSLEGDLELEPDLQVQPEPSPAFAPVVKKKTVVQKKVIAEPKVAKTVTPVSAPKEARKEKLRAPLKKNVITPKASDLAKTQNTKEPTQEMTDSKASDESLTLNDNKEEKADENIPAEENTEALENTVLNSMLKKDEFPKKTEFINKEDAKSGVVLGEDNSAKETDTAAEVSKTPELKNEEPLNKVSSKTVSPTPVLSINDSNDDMMGMFVKMLFTTLALGVVVFALAFLWKWLQGRSGKFFAGGQKGLKILSQQVIGPKSRVMIIEAMGKKYLVGATDSNIQLLADIDFYEQNPNEDISKILDEKNIFFPQAKNTFVKPAKKPDIFDDELTPPATNSTAPRMDMSSMIDKRQGREVVSATSGDSKMRPSLQIREKLKGMKQFSKS